MRTAITSSAADEIKSNIFVDASTTTPTSLIDNVTEPSVDSSHSDFVGAINLESASSDVCSSQTNDADGRSSTTATHGLVPDDIQAVDGLHSEEVNGPSFKVALKAQVEFSQSGQANIWDGASPEPYSVGDNGQSLAIAGPFASASNLSMASANGVALAPHATPGLAISGCCPGCLHWLLAEWQGEAAPTLPTSPTGIIEVGDLGAVAAPLAYVNTSQSDQSGSGTSGSTEVTFGQASAGLAINIIWDSSVANAPAAFKSVVESVVQFYESQFSNPVTLNINVGWGEVSGTAVTTVLGESESYLKSFSYSQIVSALTQNASSNAQVSAVNSMSSSAPNGNEYYLTLAEATALGLVTGTTTLDGAVGFSSTLPFSYSTTSAPSGQYYLYGVVAHELSEVMGRISLLSYGGDSSAMDLFRYTANGVLATRGTQSAYFSDNGGATSLNPFNVSPSGDFGDLSGGAGNNAFNAFSSSGVVNAITSNDLTMMNVLGYNLVSATIPKITAIAESPTTGAATVGEVIDFTLTFSQAVTVAGTPTLTLNDNGVATYAGGSGSNSLSFEYTVSANDSAVAKLTATSINLHGGTIQSFGNNALLSLAGLAQSGPQIGASDPMAINIGLIYEAVLQRAPTLAEVTASEALQSAEGTAVMTAAIVDSAEALTNVYPIMQMFELAFGHFPGLSTLSSMVSSDLTVTQLSEAVVASQTFANTYNGGTLLDPNAPVTAAIVDALYTQALGHAPTQSTLAQWLNSGLSITQAFEAMVTSQSYLDTTLPSIEQYLTGAVSGVSGAAGSNTSNVAGDLTAAQINGLYEAVLQRAPSSIEVTAALALDSATGDAATVAAIVDSAEAITNVYPILQTFELAFGYLPQAPTLASMVQSALTVSDLCSAIVGSPTFANVYNGGALINPNSPVTASIVQALYTQALGHAPTQSTLSGWLNAGLTVAEAFQDMVTSQSYFEKTQSTIEHYLTVAANGAVSVSGANMAGDGVNVVGSVNPLEHSAAHG